MYLILRQCVNIGCKVQDKACLVTHLISSSTSLAIVYHIAYDYLFHIQFYTSAQSIVYLSLVKINASFSITLDGLIQICLKLLQLKYISYRLTILDEPKIKAELFPKISTYVQRNLFELTYVFGLKFQLKDNLLYKLLLFCGYTETLIYDFDSSFNPHITYCQNYDHMVDI